MRAKGFRDFTFPPDLRPLDPSLVLCGPAFTITGVAKQTDAHETLLAWTGLLSKVPAGHIWVSQPNDRVVAHMGELSAETLKNKGVLGCVADGYIRDTNFLLSLGFPSWGRGYTPRDIVGHWLPTHTNVEIQIGDVSILPGDYLLGDRDGMVRVPKASLEEILSASEEAIATENLVRKAILEGVDPREAYLRHGKF
ncbi:MAG: RraA family protein [Mesorhizobium sp.]|nr:MAG: RraA family protein [Mesorhizobium sp.]